jgi:prophage maintenance system killer protein
MNNPVEYPTLEDIREWYVALNNRTLFEQAFFLPPLDEGWCEEMCSAFETTALLPECRHDACRAAAVIFYKINKNHYRVDGNKRSAVICTIFFFMINNLWPDITQKKFYALAKKIAKSDGGKGDAVIAMIERRFRAVLTQLEL